MTAQSRERLIYNGEEYYLATEPLFPYLKKHNILFTVTSSSCWRGYIGEWLIEENRLYLTGITGSLRNDKRYPIGGTPADLKTLFSGQERVFAEWFSGKIRIPHGRMLEYVHMGYESVYEKELTLTVENGVVTGTHET